MKVFSLFSGIGGFDLAARNLGHEIVGACEINQYARQIYAKQFPKVRLWNDATQIIAARLPYFELLCAGFPCQSFSVAGRGIGLEESRGNLFYEIARIAKEKRPGHILLENVRGLLFDDDGRTITTIIKTFYELGYNIEWQVLDSKYSTAQGRSRVFIICHLREQCSCKVFPIKEDYAAVTDTPQKIRAISIENTSSNGRRLKEPGEPSFTLSTNCAVGVAFSDDLMRYFTPTECERLQGFPDGWNRGISDNQRKICLGNAVAVPVVQQIMRTLYQDKPNIELE